MAAMSDTGPITEFATVRIRVPAKINLYLGVGAATSDGFHDLVTVFHAVDLYDDVVAKLAPRLSVSLRGPETAGVPADQRNLAWQAATLLAARTESAPHAALDITKRIPVAGGMAGGSADAAATLLACTRLWGTETSRSELALLAAELGSDVPFLLTGGTAIGTGRGERLSPVLSTATLHWTLALADGEISAGAAYRELDRQRGAHVVTPALPDGMLEALRQGDCHQLAPLLHNDLQPAALALMPSLAAVLAAGKAAGALAGIVSGSGPTCAFLSDSAAAAAELAAELETTRTCRATRTASGPVPGARVLR